MTKENLVEMEIFRTGDYGPKGSYTESDLDSLAADYRPELLEAPLTFDHAQTGPAYGWVARLRREGDRLIAAFKGVPQSVLGMIKSGAYKRRSVELFRKLPHTGKPYLRAVSLLGAATPEVKGLRDVCFSSPENAVAMEFAAGTEAGAHTTGATTEDGDVPSTTAPPDQADTASPLAVLFSDLRSEGYCLPDEEAESLAALFSSETSDASPGFALLGRLLRRALLRAPLEEQNGTGEPVTAFYQTPGSARQFHERVSRESISLHQTALQIMAADPAMPYRDALLRAAR